MPMFGLLQATVPGGCSSSRPIPSPIGHNCEAPHGFGIPIVSGQSRPLSPTVAGTLSRLFPSRDARIDDRWSTRARGGPIKTEDEGDGSLHAVSAGKIVRHALLPIR